MILAPWRWTCVYGAGNAGYTLNVSYATLASCLSHIFFHSFHFLLPEEHNQILSGPWCFEFVGSAVNTSVADTNFAICQGRAIFLLDQRQMSLPSTFMCPILVNATITAGAKHPHIKISGLIGSDPWEPFEASSPAGRSLHEQLVGRMWPAEIELICMFYFGSNYINNVTLSLTTHGPSMWTDVFHHTEYHSCSSPLSMTPSVNWPFFKVAFAVIVDTTDFRLRL